MSLKVVPYASRARLPGIHLHLWHPSICNHLPINGILSKLAVEVQISDLVWSLDGSPSLADFPLALLCLAPLFFSQHRHSPKLLTQAMSSETALFSRNNITRLYFLCSFCSFFTCLINIEHLQFIRPCTLLRVIEQASPFSMALLVGE